METPHLSHTTTQETVEIYTAAITLLRGILIKLLKIRNAAASKSSDNSSELNLLILGANGLASNSGIPHGSKYLRKESLSQRPALVVLGAQVCTPANRASSLLITTSCLCHTSK